MAIFATTIGSVSKPVIPAAYLCRNLKPNLGRARENLNDVSFKDLRGQQMSFAGYANVLRHIFWNLMDGHSMVRESEKCNYTIEAWGRRCYLVQTNRETKAIDRYEILNCTYEQLRGKISKRHEAEEVPAR